MSPAAAIPGVPLLAAAVLAVLPGWRPAAWINIGAAAATLLVAVAIAAAPPPTTAFLLADRLALHLVLLTGFIGLTTAIVSFGYIRQEVGSGRLAGPRLRLYHAMFQALLGCMLLALLSNNLGVTWMAMEAATLVGVLVVGLAGTAAASAAAWRFLVVCSVGLALALFGTVVLYLAALPALGPGLPAMSWSGLLPAASRCNATVLNLAFVFLLIGYATTAALVPLHAWMPDTHAEGPTPVAAVLAGSTMNFGLFVILRLRTLLAGNAQAIAPGPPIMVLGLLSLLLAAFGLWRRRDIRRFFACSAIGQNGVAAFAFGLGGPAAIFAGLLHLTMNTLATAAAFQCVGRVAQLKGSQRLAEIGGLIASHRGLGLVLAAAILAIAGLPPFGLFSSELLIAVQTIGRSPLLALPLGIGLVVGAWALLGVLQALCLGESTANRALALPATTLVPACLHLALVLVLGLAMPAAIVAWFAGIAGAR